MATISKTLPASVRTQVRTSSLSVERTNEQAWSLVLAQTFQAGADIVELDLHITKDRQFAVFHDWKLDYRTNGTGVTRDYTIAELKSLDVGYGYSADGGKTFPFRGKGVGLMPSLDEVLAYFPERSFLIHVKSNDPKEGTACSIFVQISCRTFESIGCVRRRSAHCRRSRNAS